MLEVLLDIFNTSWKKKSVLTFWKKAQIIALLKEGKTPKERASYRIVSLTPVLAKIMERIVTNKLTTWLINKKKINNWQAGFQPLKSTEDQILRLAQSVQDGFERKPLRKTVTVAIDC